ncbi:hypothetical protein [Salegentibacter chungangensis]|uniref:Uncharacterized protein n=1 Tax=Salegentibacter chungangensis TaxID=1335724 RepID=A0ABW3NRM1_9FLAO
MNQILNFLKAVKFEITDEGTNSFRALYSSKGIKLKAVYQDKVIRIWYEHFNIKRQLLGESQIEKAEDLQFILSKNMFLKNEFPFLMKQIQEYQFREPEACE